MTRGRKIWGALLPSRPAGPSTECITRDGLLVDESSALWMGRIAASVQQFEDWFIQHRQDDDYWPAFGEFIRGMLHECCGAVRVTPYQIADNGRELLALRGANPLVQTDRLSVRKGIIGHVVTTGRSYLAGEAAHGSLIDSLVREGDSQVEWCFLVQYNQQRIGVVTAAKVAVPSAVILGVIERLVGQFWFLASQAKLIATLEQCDPVCGLLGRPSFLEASEQAVTDSYEQGAPVAVAVLALEGLRAMNDSGRWEVADDLLREVSKFLRSKVRNEDRLGCFDGTRFVILLRCVDSELATLIIRQLIAQLSTLVGDFGRWGSSIKVRCGLAGSGTAQPSLRELVTRALAESGRAREQSRLISSDIVEPSREETPA